MLRQSRTLLILGNYCLFTQLFQSPFSRLQDPYTSFDRPTSRPRFNNTTRQTIQDSRRSCFACSANNCPARPFPKALPPTSATLRSATTPDGTPKSQWIGKRAAPATLKAQYVDVDSCFGRAGLACAPLQVTKGNVCRPQGELDISELAC